MYFELCRIEDQWGWELKESSQKVLAFGNRTSVFKAIVEDEVKRIRRMMSGVTIDIRIKGSEKLGGKCCGRI